MRNSNVFPTAATSIMMILISACVSSPALPTPVKAEPVQPMNTKAAPAQAEATVSTTETAVAPTVETVKAAEVVVYASDLQQSALSDEFAFTEDPTSPGGKMIALPNNGDKLNAPPEDDPHVTFKVQVQADIPYSCWIHMKVGAPNGIAKANLFYVQFSDAVDKSKLPVFTQGTGSYMIAQGPEQQGWVWVGCKSADPQAPESLLYFRTSGEITVRLQAGMEGSGFDQFLLSPALFLNQAPTEAIVQK
jgi:hypothetical protein